MRAASRRGSTVTFKLSENATVTFKVEQALRGRLVNGSCVKAARAGRSAQRCTRYGILRGGFNRAGLQGANTFRFTARIASRGLRRAATGYGTSDRPSRQRVRPATQPLPDRPVTAIAAR